MRGLEPPPNNGLESKPNAYTKFRHICLFYAPSGSMKTRAAATFGPPMASVVGGDSCYSDKDRSEDLPLRQTQQVPVTH